jgi:chromosome segregation ATPase
MIEQMQIKFKAASAAHDDAKRLLYNLKEKESDLAETLSGLSAAVAARQKEAKQAMDRYVGDEITDTDLSEIRGSVTNAEQKFQEVKSTVDSLKERIEQIKETVKECRNEEISASGKLWNLVAQEEEARARAAGLAALVRAYLAQKRAAPAGCTPTLREFTNEVFKAISIQPAEEEAFFVELHQKYGVSLY